MVIIFSLTVSKQLVWCLCRSWTLLPQEAMEALIIAETKLMVIFLRSSAGTRYFTSRADAGRHKFPQRFDYVLHVLFTFLIRCIYIGTPKTNICSLISIARRLELAKPKKKYRNRRNIARLHSFPHGSYSMLILQAVRSGLTFTNILKC